MMNLFLLLIVIFIDFLPNNNSKIHIMNFINELSPFLMKTSLSSISLLNILILLFVRIQFLQIDPLGLFAFPFSFFLVHIQFPLSLHFANVFPFPILLSPLASNNILDTFNITRLRRFQIGNRSNSFLLPLNPPNTFTFRWTLIGIGRIGSPQIISRIIITSTKTDLFL